MAKTAQILREAEQNIAWYVCTRSFSGKYRFRIGEVLDANIFKNRNVINALIEDRRIAPLPYNISVPPAVEGEDGIPRRMLEEAASAPPKPRPTRGPKKD